MTRRNSRQLIRNKPVDHTSEQTRLPPTKGFKFWSVLGTALLIGLIAVLAWVRWNRMEQTSPEPDFANRLSAANRALRASDWLQAEAMAVELLENKPNSAAAWWIAMQAAAAQKAHDRVRQYCHRMLACEDRLKSNLYRQAGEIAFQADSIDLSLQCYSRALERDPQDIEARQRQLYLLGLSGRLWEAVPAMRWLLDNQPANYQVLLLLGDYDRMADFGKILKPIVQRNPQDGSALLGLARIALTNQSPSQALEHLRRAQQVGLKVADLDACMGLTLFELQDSKGLSTWISSLDDMAVQHPLVWRVIGMVAKQLDQPEVARSCFLQSVTLDPNDTESVYLLATALQDSGDSENAKRMFERHRELDRLMRLVFSMYGAQPNAGRMIETAGLCERLGRAQEALAWFELVASGQGQGRMDQRKSAEVSRRSLLDRAALGAKGWQIDLPELLRSTQRFSLATNPLAEHLRSLTQQLGATTDDQLPKVTWSDVANQSGLHFNYFCSPSSNSNTQGRRLFEFGGGGVGVLDYDRDGWPDLFFTQGCQWPPASYSAPAKPLKEDDSGYHQTLFRNRQGESWSEVSHQAGIALVGFGQGVACGDFDNDGFSDLYVACIGQNLLLRNNGDGTFSDHTELVGLTGVQQWTTSCALADLTGDGLVDIYDVNYLAGPDLFDRVCTWEGGRKRICGPGTFQADFDRLWINSGQGFWDASEPAGIRKADGKGLGIVVGDLDHSGRTSMFVANDQTANFYYQPSLWPIDVQHAKIESPNPAEHPLTTPQQQAGFNSSSNLGLNQPWFEEEAQLRGLAFDETGGMQGCMGIAVGDFNRDNLIDLLVTNYVTEANTLYQQTQPGQFNDRTRAANLRHASLPMVGFGVQSVDSRLSGNLDLVVTNGHLDDFTFKSQMFEMPTQYFANDGRGIFSEITKDLGGYFSGLYRGRSMARLDWNSDGLDDLAISHLDSPAALIENQTAGVGNYLSLELVGTTSSRDCVGASVWIELAGKRQTQILTAGDGYQASNEKRLVFGLGDSKRVDQLTIRWPAGKEESYDGITQGRWIAIEALGIFPCQAHR